MQMIETKFNQIRKIGIAMVFFSFTLFMSTSKQVEAIMGGPTHIGTFEGRTTFTTGSSNGVNPGLYLQVMDRYGNYKEYTSEDGVLTIDGTKEGAYVTQAKLLGKTKYRDIHTGELLDQWEAGRDLRLESSKMPVLKTTGKNLFDMKNSNFITEKDGNYYSSSDSNLFDTYTLLPNTTYTISGIFGGWGKCFINGVNLGNFNSSGYRVTKKFTTDSTGVTTIYFGANMANDALKPCYDFQLEIGDAFTSYEPHKSNILSASEEVELRGIGEVQDELNLLTGELTQRIGEVVLDGSELWGIREFNTTNTECVIFVTNIVDKLNSWYFNCDKFKYTKVDVMKANNIEGIYGGGSPYNLFINVSKTKASTVEEFKNWLSNNNVTVQYCCQESIKTVVLTSDYYFQPVMNRDVHIDGTILPLVCSVTIPTEHLSFVLNPNEEKGKQFVAPDFSITNNTPASIYLELNTFEQLANDLNDVLPTEHENWNTLDRKQSKDIALALVPKPSDGWLSLTEGPRYVADSSNYYLGEVKAESSVDFTFEANHGRAFLETLSPRYRLSFIFDFFDK